MRASTALRLTRFAILMAMLSAVALLTARGGVARAAEQALTARPAPVEAAAAPSSLVLPPTPAPYGKPYSKWSESWWQWAVSIPVHKSDGTFNHPLFDTTGAQCGVGQSGPVWFLGGAFTSSLGPPPPSSIERYCSVPSAAALYIDIADIECSKLEFQTIGPPSAGGCASAIGANKKLTSSALDGVTKLSATVDGTLVPFYRVSTQPTTLTLPTDNLFTSAYGFTFPAGTYTSTSVDNGYFTMVAPLATGTHLIHFHAEIPAFNAIQDVTYHLSVH